MSARPSREHADAGFIRPLRRVVAQGDGCVNVAPPFGYVRPCFLPSVKRRRRLSGQEYLNGIPNDVLDAPKRVWGKRLIMDSGSPSATANPPSPLQTTQSEFPILLAGGAKPCDSSLSRAIAMYSSDMSMPTKQRPCFSAILPVAAAPRVGREQCRPARSMRGCGLPQRTPELHSGDCAGTRRLLTGSTPKPNMV